MEKRLQLGFSLSENSIQELKKNIRFYTTDLVDISVDATSVVIKTENNDSMTLTIDLLQANKTAFRSNQSGLIYQSPDHHSEQGKRGVKNACCCEYAKLPQRFSCGSGIFIESRRWHTIKHFLSNKLTDIFHHNMSTNHIIVPSLIKLNDLQQAGYFEKFPNQAQLLARLPLNPSLVNDISQGQFGDLRSAYEITDTALNPVTCYQLYTNFAEIYHRYPQLLFTVQGNVYRFESHNHSDTRMNEFLMHETVFMGSRKQVLNDRDQVLEFYHQFLQSLGIQYDIVMAYDAFYDAQAAIRKRSQLAAGSKWEIRVKVIDDDLPIGSINLHDKYFVERFKLDGVCSTISETACAGIGVDRLIYVLMATYGDNVEEAIGL